MIEGNNPEINYKELAERIKKLSPQAERNTFPEEKKNDVALKIILTNNRIKNLEEEIAVKSQGITILPPQLDIFPLNKSKLLQKIAINLLNFSSNDKLKYVREEHQSLLRELEILKKEKLH
ncbi:MAG: hypothetical protein HQK84_09810 [Nitrospinae bacterium]|nr:hypothetical protein [Nitrospinota bacterium]